MNFKVRDEYFRAAQRHLAVCRELQERIKQLQEKEVGGSSLPKSDELLKHQLLCDLYYLTGYVIECTYCMVIFNHFPKYLDKYKLVAKNPFQGKNNISFIKSKAKEQKDLEEINNTVIVADSKHRLGHFQNVFGENYLNREVPINLSLFDECIKLFEEYEAEVRYFKTETEPIKSNLNYNKVFAFLEGAKTNFQSCRNFLSL